MKKPNHAKEAPLASDIDLRDGRWVQPPAPWWFFASREDAGLLVSYFPDSGDKLVIALEFNGMSAYTKARHDMRTAATAVFDNHAHKVLGTRKTDAGARRLGERYAAGWKAGKTQIAECPCEDIAKKAKLQKLL